MNQDIHFQQPQHSDTWVQEDYDALGQVALSKFAFDREDGTVIRREAHEQPISLIHDVAGQVLRARQDESYFSLVAAKRAGEVAIVCSPLAKRIVSALSVDFLRIRLDYPLHRFSPIFKVFSSVRRLLLPVDVGSYLKRTWNKEAADQIVQAAMVVVKVLRRRLSKAVVKAAHENFRRGAIENFNGLVDAIDWLSQRCSTVTVLRFDLHFRRSGSHPIRLDDAPNIAILDEFQHYRGRFHRFLDRHFRNDLRGYAWVIEYGRESLFHVHYLVMLSPRGRTDHPALVERLGAYFSPSWTAFQADRGRCFSLMVDGISN